MVSETLRLCTGLQLLKVIVDSCLQVVYLVYLLASIDSLCTDVPQRVPLFLGGEGLWWRNRGKGFTAGFLVGATGV